MPNWPESFAPKQRTSPDLAIAHVNLCPAATATASGSSFTSFAFAPDEKELYTPIDPQVSLPQQWS